jgi:hypothetical protein
MELTNDEKDMFWKNIRDEHERLLKLYELRLHHLNTMNTHLELVRYILNEPLTDAQKLYLVQTYKEHFQNKIQSIKQDISNIIDKKEEYLVEYLS